MNLVTRDELSDFLDTPILEGDNNDQLITHVSRRMARFSGRDDWGGETERTETVDGGTQYLKTRYWPIVSVASINDDVEHVWGSDTLVDSSDYWIVTTPDNRGIIWIDYKPISWDWSIQIVYTGGYASVGAIPGDLKTAALLQIRAEALQRDSASFNEPELQFLPEVTDLLKKFTRSTPFA